MKEKKDYTMEEVYGQAAGVKERFERLEKRFKERFGENGEPEFFSAPGRTEIIGNHTDHNGGKILAGSIDKDTIGAARPNGRNIICIASEGYAEIEIDLSRLEELKEVGGTRGLVGGLVEAARNLGYQVSGFDACISTNVIAAAGVSSSASFEMLICAMINYFFNENKIEYTDYARMGQYAENVYWKKASGLMDQMACAVGGAILLDFSNKDEICYEKVEVSFETIGYRLIIVNTGKGHADLSWEYSQIPLEMKEAARALGVNQLSETTQEALLENLSRIDNDRAILRSLHFFAENSRVEQAERAVKEGDYQRLLAVIEESGRSSWELLQNCYSLQNYKEQKMSLALALTQLFTKKTGRGISRLHGGGFAGVIMCVLPTEDVDSYTAYMAPYFGKENIYPMNIRKTGAVHMQHSTI